MDFHKILCYRIHDLGLDNNILLFMNFEQSALDVFVCFFCLHLLIGKNLIKFCIQDLD